MTTYLNVVRYHLTDRLNYTILPVVVPAFVFGVDAVILANPTGDSSQHNLGGLAAIFILALSLGSQSLARTLPFGLALGLSRRSFYLGTALLAVALAATIAVAITVGQAIERATGGWGMSMEFFRVPYILDGPWYLTWVTSFVGLTLLFGYGMWFGLILHRWRLLGLFAFVAAQLTALLLAMTATHTWPEVGNFFTALSAAGLTGLLAAVTAGLLAGGLVTMRRLTV
jgi:hypothetical protein